MIEREQLRIGNWVLDNKTKMFVQVEGIQFSGRVVVYDNSWLDAKRPIEPHGISLSPEILEKCGLERRGNRFKYHHFMFIMDDSLWLTDGKWRPISKRLQYVHDIQNLTQSLTGEELVIKL